MTGRIARRFLVILVAMVATLAVSASPAFAVSEGDPCPASSEGLIVVENGHHFQCQRTIGYGGTGFIWTCVGA